jgi:hypothetical protein
VDSVPGPGSAGTRLRVTECTFRNMHGGIRTNSACSFVTLGDNAYTAVTIKQSLADRAATRVYLDRSRGDAAPLTVD